MLGRCVILFVLDFVADILCTLHIQACAYRSILMATLTVLAIYLVGFFGHRWFVETPCPWMRFWLTLSGGLGAAAGTATVIYLGDIL